jgi:hypothetical protein
MIQASDEFSMILKLLATVLSNSQYAIRGTASLVLQNIDMKVTDIDIICDQQTALKANDLFAQNIIDPVSYKESPKFKSYFGKFKINGVDVEFMGDWQIKDTKGNWSEVFDGSNYTTLDLDGTPIKVATVDQELRMFLLMGRFSAYHKIKKQLPNTNNKNATISGQEKPAARPLLDLFSEL